MLRVNNQIMLVILDFFLVRANREFGFSLQYLEIYCQLNYSVIFKRFQNQVCNCENHHSSKSKTIIYVYQGQLWFSFTCSWWNGFPFCSCQCDWSVGRSICKDMVLGPGSSNTTVDPLRRLCCRLSTRPIWQRQLELIWRSWNATRCGCVMVVLLSSRRYLPNHETCISHYIFDFFLRLIFRLSFMWFGALWLLNCAGGKLEDTLCST